MKKISDAELFSTRWAIRRYHARQIEKEDDKRIFNAIDWLNILFENPGRARECKCWGDIAGLPCHGMTNLMLAGLALLNPDIIRFAGEESAELKEELLQDVETIRKSELLRYCLAKSEFPLPENLRATVYDGMDPERYIKVAFNNKALLEQSEFCGCYRCGEIYLAREIDPDYYIITDSENTAQCMFCAMDSVIPLPSNSIKEKELLCFVGMYAFGDACLLSLSDIYCDTHDFFIVAHNFFLVIFARRQCIKRM